MQTIHSCWLHALAGSDGTLPVSVTVRDEAGAIAFEVECGGVGFDGLQDRVAALGSRVSVEQSPGHTRVSGFLLFAPGGAVALRSTAAADAPATRSTAAPGRDGVRADRPDRVAGDCEVVQRG